MKVYVLDENKPNEVPHRCNNPSMSAYSTASDIGGNEKVNYAMTLCQTGFFERYTSTLDTSQTDPNTYLDNIQPRSMTIIHEMYHLAAAGSKSEDLRGMVPPTDIKPLDEAGNPNPKWPGDPANFVIKKDEKTGSVLQAGRSTWMF